MDLAASRKQSIVAVVVVVVVAVVVVAVVVVVAAVVVVKVADIACPTVVPRGHTAFRFAMKGSVQPLHHLC